jgi:glycosyltransferase involved in cell wall biosynthesis
VRARNRIAREAQTRLGKFTPSLLGYGAGAMLKVASAEKADLTIVHSETGLWVGGRLLDKGLRVGVDFEDWFSEDLLPESRSSRPVEHLKSFERRLMQECLYRLTTSHVLAEALAEAYGAEKPAVIPNVFPFAERENMDGEIRDRRDLSVTSLHWFSQTIGPSRGLETLFQSLRYIDLPAEIHLRGNYSESTRQWVESLVPREWNNRVFLHKTVANAELLSRISEHDIGLALEIPYCSNRQLTITNKLFQYLQAGLAVVATDTLGQSEVFTRCPDIGRLVASGDPQALASAIAFLVRDREKLSESKAAALGAARETFSWEREAGKLLREAENALSAPAPSGDMKVVSSAITCNRDVATKQST